MVVVHRMDPWFQKLKGIFVFVQKGFVGIKNLEGRLASVTVGMR